MKYVKLNLSFGDKLKVMFFGIIPEDKLPVVEVEVQVDKIINKQSPKTTTIEVPDDLNKEEEEKFQVPFFDLQDDDVKSNF